jgi:hypothetical protein
MCHLTRETATGVPFPAEELFQIAVRMER